MDYSYGMNTREKRIWTFLRVELGRHERRRLDAVCGPGQPMKRGAWVRRAIVEALERDEAAKNATA